MQTNKRACVIKIFKHELADERKCVIVVTHSPDVSKLADCVFELKGKN